MIVGLAGGAGAGKSTLATALADHLGAAVVRLDDHYRSADRALDRNRPDAFDVPGALAAVRAAGPTVVLEGHFVLALAEVRAVCTHRIWLETPPDVRLARKLLRQSRTTGPPSLADAATRYLTRVRPGHERHVAPSRAYAEVVVDGLGPLADQLAAALAALR